MLKTVRTAPATTPRVLLPRSRAGAARHGDSRRGLTTYAMQQPEFAGKPFTILSTGEAATAHLASLLAAEMREGDAYCCKGDEGAGKSTFCNAFIRAANENAGLYVPSPTQTLQPNVFPALKGPEIHHLDLRHLGQPSSAELDQLADTFERVVSLVEWADRLQAWGAAPEQRLALWFRRLPSGAMGASADAPVRLLTVVPHSAAWELRAGLLESNLACTGTAEGLIVLSTDMAANLIQGTPEHQVMLQRAMA